MEAIKMQREISTIGPGRYCADPDCACARCLETSDRIAQSGLIPTSFAWWMAQTHFPVELATADWRVR